MDDPLHDRHQRFAPYGVPPDKQGDYAYLLHIVRSLKSTGKGACILPHGVLFRGNAEADIRRNLLKRGYIKAIIGLPANLFYGTGIPACIVVIDKADAAQRSGVFMIDASKGFMKDGPKNRLRAQDIHKIVDTFRRQDTMAGYSRFVPFAEIEKNDFNLNLPRYIDSTEREDAQNIDAHLSGGIPQEDIDALHAYWAVLPGLQAALFAPSRPGFSTLAVKKDDIRATIFAHPEFRAFTDGMQAHFAAWRSTAAAQLKALQPGFHPRELIDTLSESLLAHYKNKPLLDAYDVYQHLMDYWTETMQDDADLISGDGWTAVPDRIVETDKKGKQKDKGWACDLVPKELLVARFFTQEQAALDALNAELEGVAAQLAELEEEHSGDDAAFSGFDKINAAAVKDRLKEIKGDPDADDERAVLNRWMELSAQESRLKKAVKEADAQLDAQAYARYAKLTEADVKALVVDDKWLAALDKAVQGEMERVSQSLTQRVKELAERYEHTLSELTARVDALEAKVNAHLKKMGFAWN